MPCKLRSRKAAWGQEPIASELGEGVQFVKTDLRDDEQIASCVEQTVATFSGVDFLVNLACVYTDEGVATSREDFLDAFIMSMSSAERSCSSTSVHIYRNMVAARSSTSGASAPRSRSRDGVSIR